MPREFWLGVTMVTLNTAFSRKFVVIHSLGFLYLWSHFCFGYYYFMIVSVAITVIGIDIVFFSISVGIIGNVSDGDEISLKANTEYPRTSLG